MLSVPYLQIAYIADLRTDCENFNLPWSHALQ